MIQIERHFGWPTRWPTSKTSGTGSNAIFRKIFAQIKIGKGWVDPMCGRDRRCEFRNDINKAQKAAKTHMDALAFLKTLPSGKFNGVVYDPPYNDAQGKEYTKLFVSKNNVQYWWDIRKEISRILKPGGLIVLLSWNTNTFRDCDLIKVWIVAHGSERNDTLVSLHRKMV